MIRCFSSALAWAGLLLGALEGCAGAATDDSSVAERAVMACTNLCTKYGNCIGQGGLDCDSICTEDRLHQSGPQGGQCDLGRIGPALDDCIQRSCDELQTCQITAMSLCHTPPPASGGTPSYGGAPALPPVFTTTADMTTCQACDALSACCVYVNTRNGQPTTGCAAYSFAQCETAPDRLQQIDGCAAATRINCFGGQ